MSYLITTIRPKRTWTFLFLFLFIINFSGCSYSTQNTTGRPSQTNVSTTANSEKATTLPKNVSTKNPPKKSSPIKSKRTPSKKSSNSQKLAVHFIDVGQGDATLITLGQHAMLIDAGDNSKGTTVQLYLQKQGITSLDYVIGTHPDSDHIGGLDVIIYKFACKNILLSKKTNTTATYRDVIDSIQTKNYKIQYPELHQKYTFGNASFSIIGPTKNYDNSNDNSIAIRFTYKNTSFLFMGDTSAEAEKDILSGNQKLSTDVLKIAHHGSKYSTSPLFLDTVHPTYSVISCGINNRYGFPTSQTLNLLRQKNISLFRTDEQGSITATTSGQKISWNCSPTTDWKAGESTRNSSTHKNLSIRNNNATNSNIQNSKYILNTNTKKFHKPTCFCVTKMAPKNKKGSSLSKQELIKKGYSPCGYCKP